MLLASHSKIIWGLEKRNCKKHMIIFLYDEVKVSRDTSKTK